MNATYERLVLVHNPHSSAAKSVEKNVYNRLRDEGQLFETLATPSADPEDLANEFSDRVRVGDRLIVAGGDGTYNLAVNALYRSIKTDTQLGFMPFGNRCDGAHLAGRKKKDIFAMADPAWEPTAYFPLHHQVTGDEDRARYALSYISIGDPMTRGAAYFSEPAIRARIIRTPSLLRLPMSGLAAGGYIRQNIRHFAGRHFPDGTELNGERLPDDVSDIVALNGLTMATLLHNLQRSFLGETYRQARVGTDARGITRLGIAALSPRGLPGEEVTTTRLIFPEGHTTYLQADGEAQEMKNVALVEITKPDTPLSVLVA